MTHYGFRQVARMEWIRLRSLRSTWCTLALTIAAAVGIGVAVGVKSRSAMSDVTNMCWAEWRSGCCSRAEGRSNAAIAAHLVVREGAVENHVANIFSMLNLPDHNRRVLAVLRYLT